MNKIEPCKIMRKFFANTYEVEMPKGVGTSPIFNIANLFLYQGPVSEAEDEPINEV